MRIDKDWKFRTEVQRVQQIVCKKVNKIKRDHEEDRRLISLYKAGSEEAGRTLINNYLDIISEIYRYPYHRPIAGRGVKGLGVKKPNMNAYDKEDIIQEILYAFFVLVEECDEDRNFEGLIKGKLHHRFFNHFFEEYIENDSKEEEYEDNLESKYIDLSQKVSIILDSEHTEKLPKDYLKLYESFNWLSSRQREVIEMSVIKGWSSIEIGKEIDIDPKTVRVHLKRGLDKLKLLMGA